MATGGIPMARVFVVLVLFAVPATLVTIDQPAVAQDASGLLKTGLEQLRAGKYDEAIATLRKAVAADPTNEEVMNSLGRAEYEALLGLIASGQEGANIDKAMLDKASPVLTAKAFNQGELNGLVKTAVTSRDYSERFEARMKLARVYGEFAVPGLVAYLSSSNTEYRIAAHIALSRGIGRDAVLPLCEALASGDSNVRRMVAAELGMIGDPRATAALASAAANDADEMVKQAASNAMAKLAGGTGATGKDASSLYQGLAGHYYAGDFRVMSYSDRPLVLWSWGTDGLTNTPVPRHLYVLKLAEEAAYDALAADSSNAGAASLLARIIASEKISSDMFSAVNDDDLTKTYAASLANAAGTCAALGWNTLARAVGEALDQRDSHAAAFLLGVMPHVYGSTDFTADNPVVRGTGDSSGTVRLAATEAVLRFNGVRRVTAFPDPDGFINRVAAAAGAVVPHQILVVDSNDDRRNKMLTELNKASYSAFDARIGSDGVVIALRYSGLDLVIVSADLGDMDTLGMINKLRSEDRTKNTPVLVVGSAEQAANQEWRSLFDGKAKNVVGIADGPGAANDEFLKMVASSLGGNDPAASARYARAASVLDALAHTDAGNALFNWNSLTETLSALLSAELPSDPPVRLNAIRAMANIGDSNAVGALVGFFGSTDDDALRAAAGNAIAAICRNGSVALDDAAFAALIKGTGSDNADVRTAAFAALGSSALTPAQSIACATRNRPG